MTTYTHTKSLRHTTDEQFSDGTTVDGNRIDRALGEMVGHFNDIPPGDVLSRFTESKYVFGYQPVREYLLTKTAAGTYYYAHHYPWMPIANSASTSVTAGQTAQNPINVKGVAIDEERDGNAYYVRNAGTIAGANWVGDWTANATAPPAVPASDRTTVDGPGMGYQYRWMMPFVFENAAIIDDLMVSLIQPRGGNYATFEDVAVPPTQTSEVSVCIMVDNNFAKERRDLASVELASHRYDLGGWEVTGASHAPFTDMAPAHQDGETRGRVFRWRDLNIPVHPKARARLMITLPWTKSGARPFGLTYTTGGAEVATAPFFYFAPGGCMTVLEELTG